MWIGQPRCCSCGAALAALLLASVPGPALGADTTETFDAGGVDVEGYAGVEGLTPEADATALYSSLMVGYGIVERFSAYLSTGVHANEELSEGHVDLAFGVFGTPVDTAHFDWDLFLGASAGGPGLDEVQLGPATEVNLDLAPDQSLAGLYLRGGVPICSRARQKHGTEEATERETAFHIGMVPGLYWTVTPGYQLLAELDMSFEPGADEGERTVTVGGVALGNNVELGDTVELITQVSVDLPQDDEQAAVGMMVGFIATLPGLAAPQPAE